MMHASKKMIESGTMPAFPAPGFTLFSATHADITTMMPPPTFARVLEEGESENERILETNVDGF